MNDRVKLSIILLASIRKFITVTRFSLLIKIFSLYVHLNSIYNIPKNFYN